MTISNEGKTIRDEIREERKLLSLVLTKTVWLDSRGCYATVLASVLATRFMAAMNTSSRAVCDRRPTQNFNSLEQNPPFKTKTRKPRNVNIAGTAWSPIDIT
jgi:hypothetical protein